MDSSEARRQLDAAARLGGRARRSARWYVAYLLVFAVASYLLCGAYAFWPARTATLVAIPLWGVFVVVSSIWANRRPASVRGFARLHVAVMVAWAAVWVVLVLVGSLGSGGAAAGPAWWLGAGLALPAVLVAGAVVAHRRSRP